MHTHVGSLPTLVSIARSDVADPREQVGALLSRCATLSSGISELSMRWDAQLSQWDALLDQAVISVFPRDVQARLGSSVHETVLAAAGKGGDQRLRDAAAQIRRSAHRHSEIGIEPVADMSGICDVEGTSLRHYPKAKATDSHFKSTLARALMPVPAFFRPARGFGLPSLPARSSGAVGGFDANALTAAEQHSTPHQQSFGAFTASARKLSARHVLGLLVVGKVPAELARAAEGAARALSGLQIELLPPVLKLVRKAKLVSDDLAAAALAAARGAEQSLGVSQQIAATLVVVAAPLEFAEEGGAALGLGKVLLISTLQPQPQPPYPAAVAGVTRLGGAGPTARLSNDEQLARLGNDEQRRAAIVSIVVRTQRALGRFIGIDGCSAFRCVFAALEHNVCMHHCPLCLRKVLWATPARLEELYETQRQHLLNCGGARLFQPELRWLDARMRFLFEDGRLLDHRHST
ncbi:hypothetical protein KFE25_008253 [Diacronema lutheri]|uniref:Uncharacterized protein n=1 Tax=Diacronema lutheri TaxID=2081491 RepID=A0A8J5XNF9_DIALT|nr:hypothetical protein KFE25_008253 [Diacronema lutheri]